MASTEVKRFPVAAFLNKIFTVRNEKEKAQNVTDSDHEQRNQEYPSATCVGH